MQTNRVRELELLVSLRVCGSQPGGSNGLGDCGTVKLGRQRLLRIAGGGGGKQEEC